MEADARKGCTRKCSFCFLSFFGFRGVCGFKHGVDGHRENVARSLSELRTTIKRQHSKVEMGGLLSQNGLNAQGAWATDGRANPSDHPTSFPLFTWIYLTGAGYFSFLLFAAGVNKLRRHTAGGRLSRILSSGGRTLSEKTIFILLQLYIF